MREAYTLRPANVYAPRIHYTVRTAPAVPPDRAERDGPRQPSRRASSSSTGQSVQAASAQRRQIL